MLSSILLREHSRNSPKLLYALAFVRSMGGGPRTFPGGLNKWQWKRLHEKKASEKEKKLLDQEKHLYQARIRSQIRAKLAGQCDTNAESDQSTSNYGPMSAKDQIKALADRFMKEGAEDLWNEADGPIKSLPAQQPITNNRSIGAPINVRNLVSGFKTSEDSERIGNSRNLSCFIKARDYFVEPRRKTKSRFNFRRNENSTSDDDSELEGGMVRPSGGNARWPRFGSSRNDASENGNDEEEDEEEEDEMDGRRKLKKMMSSAALGKYDSIKKRRVPLKSLEEEVDVSEEIHVIRNELMKRNSSGNLEQKSEQDDSILSEKRYTNHL